MKDTPGRSVAFYVTNILPLLNGIKHDGGKSNSPAALQVARLFEAAHTDEILDKVSAALLDAPLSEAQRAFVLDQNYHTWFKKKNKSFLDIEPSIPFAAIHL